MMGDELCSLLPAVGWGTTCVVGDELVWWVTNCVVGDELCGGLRAVWWVKSCVVGDWLCGG